MTPLNFALCLTTLALGSLAQKTDLKSSLNVHHESGFVSANVGASVTFRCFYEDDAVMFYWYKQTGLNKPRVVSKFYVHEKSGTFHSEFKNNSRFTLDTGNGKNHLTISDIQISDSASYYCMGIFGYNFEFVEGFMLTVKGSGINIQTLVHQPELMSASDTIQPGGSALSCIIHTHTCDSSHRVYWFKESAASQPGLIYTNGVRNDECEKRTETQTHTCFFNLAEKSLNLFDAGTRYCAVASCGRMLFGDGKGSHLAHEEYSLVLVYFLIGALTFTTILVVMLAYAAFTIHIKMRCQSTGSHGRSAAASTEGSQDSDNLHYAALREYKVSRSKRQRDNTDTECVYSRVKL